jgi:hypothetical protein
MSAQAIRSCSRAAATFRPIELVPITSAFRLPALTAWASTAWAANFDVDTARAPYAFARTWPTSSSGQRTTSLQRGFSARTSRHATAAVSRSSVAMTTALAAFTCAAARVAVSRALPSTSGSSAAMRASTRERSSSTTTTLPLAAWTIRWSRAPRLEKPITTR